MKALHGRLPIPQATTALPGRIRRFADRFEAWIYDHANLARWDSEDVTAEWQEAAQALRAARSPRIFVHHVPTGLTRGDVERAFTDVIRARQRSPRWCR